MPVYEYRCSGCGWKFARLVGMVAGASAEGIVCPKCGGANVQRLICKFSRLRGEDERLDSMEDAALAGGDDASSMSKLCARWAGRWPKTAMTAWRNISRSPSASYMMGARVAMRWILPDGAFRH